MANNSDNSRHSIKIVKSFIQALSIMKHVRFSIMKIRDLK